TDCAATYSGHRRGACSIVSPMPIRINLLAEQQAAEEMGRRDPVKRATWASALLIGILVLVSGYLQFQLMVAMRVVNKSESEWNRIEPDFTKITSNLNKIAEAERKWAALQSLA